MTDFASNRAWKAPRSARINRWGQLANASMQTLVVAIALAAPLVACAATPAPAAAAIQPAISIDTAGVRIRFAKDDWLADDVRQSPSGQASIRPYRSMSRGAILSIGVNPASSCHSTLECGNAQQTFRPPGIQAKTAERNGFFASTYFSGGSAGMELRMHQEALKVVGGIVVNLHYSAPAPVPVDTAEGWRVLDGVSVGPVRPMRTVVVPVPHESWGLRFQGPELEQRKDAETGGRGSVYSGSVDQQYVWLFVYPPKCPGGDSNSARFACFSKDLANWPGMEVSEIESQPMDGGLLVTYRTRTRLEGHLVQTANAHLLFTHAGKAGNFHATIVDPLGDDFDSVIALVRSARIVDR